MIKLTHIEKEYDRKPILRDISLEIAKGASIAFVGPNGCGKSTLLKIIAGLVRPTRGKVCPEQGKLIHYVPEHFPKMSLTPLQYLTHMGRLDGMSASTVKTRLEELAEDFYVTSMLSVPMKHLSKGSLQKIGVIQALMKSPDILLLDEPLSGQDVASQQVFIRKIKELEQAQTTVLMSCHEPFLVDALAKEAYSLLGGQLKATTLAPTKKQIRYTLFFVRSKEASMPEKWHDRLQFTESGCSLRVAEEECDAAITEMIRAGWNLRGMWNEEHDTMREISI